MIPSYFQDEFIIILSVKGKKTITQLIEISKRVTVH